MLQNSRWCLTTEFVLLLFGFILFIFCFFLNKSIISIKPIILNYRNTQLHKRTISPLSSTKFSLILLKISQHFGCESLRTMEKNGKSPIALVFSFEKVSAWRSTQACFLHEPTSRFYHSKQLILKISTTAFSFISMELESSRKDRSDANRVAFWCFHGCQASSFGFLKLGGSGYLILQVWVFFPIELVLFRYSL
jgi:hypothetical protein